MAEKKEMALVEKREESLSTNILATGRGFDEMDSSDLIVPYVKIMQPLSPEVQDDDIKAKQGDLLNSLSQFNYGTSIKFIPLMFRKRRIKWISRDDGGGMECASLNGLVPDTGELHAEECRLCKYSQWINNEPPVCDLIYGFPSIVLDTKQENKLVIVSFARTSFGAGKKLINQMRFAGGDMFGRPYEIATKKEKNDKGTFFILTAKPAGELVDKEFAEAESYYNMLQNVAVKYHEEEIKTGASETDEPPF